MDVISKLEKLRTGTKKTWEKRVKVAGEDRFVKVEGCLTTMDLSIEIGYDYNIIYMVESGRRPLNLKVLFRVLEYYKVPFQQFFEGVPYNGYKKHGQKEIEEALHTTG